MWEGPDVGGVSCGRGQTALLITFILNYYSFGIIILVIFAFINFVDL